MKTFIIFHYRYNRELWKHTSVQAYDEKSAREAFRKFNVTDHITDILAMRA